MHSRTEHSLTPQSAPYKSGVMARASAVTWKRSNRHTIAASSTRGLKVFSRPKKAKIVGSLSETLKGARLEMLTRSLFDSTNTEVKAPASKIFVCPERVCGQQFHEDTTKQMVIDHLMYGIHTSFSFHRGDSICPFSCEKGFHDVDLLKAHIQERKCLLAKEFDNIQEAIRYQAEMEPHLQRAQSLDFTCIPCKKSYATLQELFFHVHGAGCRYMDYKDIYTNVPVIDKDPRIILLEPRLL